LLLLSRLTLDFLLLAPLLLLSLTLCIALLGLRGTRIFLGLFRLGFLRLLLLALTATAVALRIRINAKAKQKGSTEKTRNTQLLYII
jgi:hypothetical protein